MVKKSLLLLVVLLFGSMSLLRAQEVVYSFEGDLQGWTVIDADGDGFNWDLCSIIQAGYTIPSHSGEDCISSESYAGYPLTPDNYIVSPQGQYASISFWACAQDPSYAAEHFGVAVSTTSNTSAAAFTTIDEWTMTAKSNGASGNYASRSRAGREGEWYQYSVDLSAYAGQDIYVAIRHFDCTDMFILNVDDITLTVPDNNVVIDFETGDFSQYEFTNTSTYPWIVVEEDGNHFAKSGNGGIASSTSTLSATHEFAEAGYIAFDYNCMGEGSSTFWDHCDFIIDGTQVFTHGADHQGWDFILSEVAAGTHTFTWSYTKDSSVNPTGDYFAIDNIVFGEGEPCVAPASITATGGAGGAVVTWGGNAESFTLGYKAVAATTWTEVAGITANTYTITGIEAGNYDVRVQADCAPGNYATGTFTAFGPNQTTANWYGIATYASGSSSGNFVTFSMSDMSTVTSLVNPGAAYAAEYANGYVWIISTSGTLYKATLDNEAQMIGVPLEIASGFESQTATEMSYNPVDGMMYYISTGDSSDNLMKFDPANPTAGATLVGANEEHLYAFAINADGVAYGIRNDGGLYTVDLTTAAQTFVGSTGVSCAYVQTMAFDTETNELFWAQIYSASSYGMYRIDPTTGSALYLGAVADVIEFVGLFSVYGSTVGETISDVMLNGFVAPVFGGHPNFDITPASTAYTVQSVNWYHGNAVMTAEDTFDEEGADYYMVVNVAPAEGFEFAETVNVYFNGSASIYDATNSEIVDGVLHASTIVFNVYNTTVYNFEDSTMQGWTTIDADGDGYTWMLASEKMGTGYGHEGSIDCVLSQSYDNSVGPLTPDNYLVSPEKANYSYIGFWACGQDAGYAAEHFGVAVSTGGNTSGSDFVTIDEWTLSAKGVGAKSVGRGGETRDQGNWYKFEVDLNAYAGQEIWVAIRHFDCTDMFYIDVDDIELAMGDAVVENMADVMAIYPNPAKDRVMVTSEVTVNEYRIYDVTGAEVMSNKVNNSTFEVNVDNLAAGVYYMRIYSDGLVQSKKFIVE